MRPGVPPSTAISNELGQLLEFRLAEIYQRRTDWPGRTSNCCHPRLHDRDRITLSPVSNRNVRQHELSQAGIDLFVITLPYSCIELLCKVRKEIEDCGRVCRHTHFQVRKREGFCRWQAASVGQPVAQPVKDASH